jgi:hypothetical protein
MIAKKIIKIAQTGVHDAAQLSALAITQLGIRQGRLSWRPFSVRMSLVALNGHADAVAQCPLLGGKAENMCPH